MPIAEDLAATESAATLAARIRRKEISPVEVVDAAIARIEAHNPKINALIILGFDDAGGETKLTVSNFAGKSSTPVSEIYVKRPKDCEGACLCAQRVSLKVNSGNGTLLKYQSLKEENGKWYFDSSPVKCIELKQQAVGMGVETARYERDDQWFSWDPDIVFKPQLLFVENEREYRQVFLTSGFGPRAIAISVENDKLLLDPLCTDAELKEHENCRPATVQ